MKPTSARPMSIAARALVLHFSFFSLFLVSFPQPAHSDFAELGAGARPSGMANAHSAIADDASALQFNPGGLAGLIRPELLANYSRLFVGLADGSAITRSHLAYAHPTQTRGTFALGLQELKLAGAFSERVTRLGYARKIERFRLEAGASLKLLQRSFSLGGDPRLAVDPLFSRHGTSAQALSLDAGLLHRRSERLSLAFAVLDLNEPDLGLGSADKVPRAVSLGAALRPRKHFVCDFDFVRRGKDWDALVGAERWFRYKSVGARGGLGFGSRNDRDLSFGASYRSHFFQFDYALTVPFSGIAGTVGNHNVSMTMRFGRKGLDAEDDEEEADAARDKSISEQIVDISKTLELTRQGNEATRGVLEKLEARLAQPLRYGGPAPAAKKEGEEPAKPKPAERPRSYKVAAGDTLQSIAQKLYGNPARWMDIYRVNQSQIGAGGKLNPGQQLMLP